MLPFLIAINLAAAAVIDWPILNVAAAAFLSGLWVAERADYRRITQP